MTSSKGKLTDPKLREKVTEEIKAKPNKDGSGKGKMAAWKAAQIGKEYEARGGDYTNEAGSKNKPQKGPPEKKSEATKSKETHPDHESDDKDYEKKRDSDYDGAKTDREATHSESDKSEYAMIEKEYRPKEADKIGAKKNPGDPGFVKKGTAKPIKKNTRAAKPKQKKEGTRKSPRLPAVNTSGKSEAESPNGAGGKRKSSGEHDNGSAKKAKN